MPKDPFHVKYGPWALVAGASEGLGAAYARQLAARGLHLVLVARREGPLVALAEELRAAHAVEIVTAPMDLASPTLAAQLASLVEGREVGLLVYNACASSIGRFLDIAPEAHATILDVNCRGPLVAARLLAPPMVARGRGGILLMSSMSGFQGTSMIASYAASKAFDIVLGEALWEELGREGVDVLVCAAGSVDTPNFRAGTPADKQKGTFPMAPDDVARQALDRLGRAGPTWVPGALNRMVRSALDLVPRRAAVRFFSRTTRGIYE